MKLCLLIVVALLVLGTLSWVVLSSLTGSVQPEIIAGAGEPSAAPSSRSAVSSLSPEDTARSNDANAEESGNATEPGEATESKIKAAAGTKKFERWWVPMSPQEFAEGYAMKADAERAYLSEFDTDGDGFVSWAERAFLVAEKVSISDADMARYFDSDGDGALSEIERAEGEAVMAAKSAETASWIEESNLRLARRLERFDADGDGRLNLDESYAAYLSDVDTKAIERFRGRYDTNDDRAIDAADLAVFMTRYADEDPRADANDDGAIDERDIEAFEIMMSLQRVP